MPRPDQYSDKPEPPKPTHEELEAQVEAFLAAKGEIKHIAPGVMTKPAEYGNPLEAKGYTLKSL